MFITNLVKNSTRQAVVISGFIYNSFRLFVFQKICQTKSALSKIIYSSRTYVSDSTLTVRNCKIFKCSRSYILSLLLPHYLFILKVSFFRLFLIRSQNVCGTTEAKNLSTMMHETLKMSTAQLSTFLTSSLPPLITLYFTTPHILAQPVLLLS